MKAIVLLSGGLDSTTVAAIAKADGRELYGLTINYNQRHLAELSAAERVADFFGIKHRILFPIDLRLFGGSSLTSDSIGVTKNVPLDKIGKEIPSSYVPARNTIFLSLAMAFAETVSASEIYIGVSSVDSSGYPDCREEFITAFERLVLIATKQGTSSSLGLKIKAPLQHLSKAETIRRGTELGVDYSLTWTCYDPSPTGLSCGLCESCLLRLQGFREAGINDPLAYDF